MTAVLNDIFMEEIISKKPENPNTLSLKEIIFWQKIMNDQLWSTHAYYVLVLGGVDIDILNKNLSSLLYVVVNYGWDIDIAVLMEFTEEYRNNDFIKQFLKYVVSNKPYFVENLREYLSSKEQLKKLAKYVH